eukprot:8464546-Lingulodinium_polyedra.AAC.1
MTRLGTDDMLRRARARARAKGARRQLLRNNQQQPRGGGATAAALHPRARTGTTAYTAGA